MQFCQRCARGKAEVRNLLPPTIVENTNTVTGGKDPSGFHFQIPKSKIVLVYFLSASQCEAFLPALYLKTLTSM